MKNSQERERQVFESSPKNTEYRKNIFQEFPGYSQNYLRLPSSSVYKVCVHRVEGLEL